MSGTYSIHIEAPVEKVFDFYRDPYKAWSVMPDQMSRISTLTEVKTTSEGVGTYESWALNLGGLRVEGFDVVTEFVPNQRITSRSSRSFVGTWTYTFEPEGSGTRLTMQRRLSSIWALPFIDQMSERMMAPRYQETLAKLKAKLEEASEPAAGSAASGPSTR